MAEALDMKKETHAFCDEIFLYSYELIDGGRFIVFGI